MNNDERILRLLDQVDTTLEKGKLTKSSSNEGAFMFRIVGVITLLVLANVGYAQPVAQVGDKEKKPLLVLESGGHMKAVTHMAFSSDGKTLVTFSQDNTVRYWNVKAGEAGTVLRFEGPPITGAATVADGQVFAMTRKGENSVDVSANGQTSVFSIMAMKGEQVEENGKKRLVVNEGHGQPLTKVAMSLSGGIKIASGDRSGEIWLGDLKTNIKKRLRKRSNELHKGMVLGLAFSPDGANVASCGSDGKAWVWSVEDEKGNTELKGHGGMVTAICWSSDGRSLATASADESLRVWSKDGEMKHEFKKCGKGIFFLSFTPDETELVFARDGES